MPIDISARVESGGLLRLLDQADMSVKKDAAEKVMEVSLAGEKRIKQDMPVDTGRARASWGHWTPGDLFRSNDGIAGDAHFKASSGGLSVEQGSNLGYIGGLNEGNSDQAPAGFIDVAAAVMGKVLQHELFKIVFNPGRLFK